MVRKLDENAGKCLAAVPEEYVFQACDGSIFRNLRDLRDGLANMTEETYVFHANAGKNDFSKWVNDVVHDAKLADGLRASASRTEAAKLVSTRIISLSRKAPKG